jgi:predicted ribosome quality control (RQC) complex YloA/Tae2 family protein
MRIVIDTRKSIEENAALYFERAKRAKRKIEGARKAMELATTKLAAHAEAGKEKTAAKAPRPERKTEWYEKLRWSYTSDGFLLVGGRDASTNEIVVKKHAMPGDVVFHTDMAGSPFVVIKAEGKEIPETTKEEAAQFTASFSRAWKQGYSILEVFCVQPEQLSKEPNTGEFLPKGAFVVRGHVTYFKPNVELAIGKLPDGRAMAGAPSAVLSRCGGGFMVTPGNDKTSDVAKRLAHALGVHVDDIVPLLPAGGVKLGKELRVPRVRSA